MNLNEVISEIFRKEDELNRLSTEINELKKKRRKLEDEMDEQHFVSPEPGDFWHEMYSPVFIVLAVEDGSVTICEKTKAVYEELDQTMVMRSYENPEDPAVKKYFSRPRKNVGYTFDVNETKTVSRSEFEKMLKCYSSMPDNLTYRCIPGRAKEFVKIWKETNGCQRG